MPDGHCHPSRRPFCRLRVLACFVINDNDKYPSAWTKLDCSITNSLYEKGNIQDPVMNNNLHAFARVHLLFLVKPQKIFLTNDTSLLAAFYQKRVIFQQLSPLTFSYKSDSLPGCCLT